MLLRHLTPYLLLTLPLAGWAKASLSSCLEHYQQGKFAQALPYCQQAAEKNDGTAQYLLGTLYQTGKGTQPNFQLALSWYKKAAQQGSANAQLKLAKKYSSEAISEPDYVKAIQFYTLAAVQDHPEAQFILAICHQLGLGVPPDYTSALYWYHQAVKNGFPDAYPIASSQVRDKEVPNLKMAGHPAFIAANKKKASDGSLLSNEEKMVWLSLAAEEGHSQAQYDLAMHYLQGNLTIQDDTKALHWLEKAAAQNHQQAQTYLAWMHALGLGTRANLNEALKYFVQSRQNTSLAKTDDEAATTLQALSLSEMTAQFHHAIDLVERSQEKEEANLGVEVIEKVAQHGYLPAQVYLAKAYQAGLFIEKNPQLAAWWYKKAAQQDHAGAQTALGWLYFYGEGVPKNYQQAYQYFSKASKLGDLSAQPGKEIAAAAMIKQNPQHKLSAL